MLDRPDIDWTKPVQWNSGEPCTAERVDGFILITLDQRPNAIRDFMRLKHFQDSLVVYEDDGTVVSDPPIEAWVENVERPSHAMESIIGTF